MTTTLTPIQSFTEKLQTKIREDISGLLPDEVIAEMVKKATESLFFTKRTKEIKDPNGWGYKTVPAPSEFEDMVQTAVEKTIQQEAQKQVDTWITNNPNQIPELVKETIQNGLATAIIKSLNHTLADLLLAAQADTTRKLAEKFGKC